MNVRGIKSDAGGKIILGVRPEDCHVAPDAEHLKGQVYGVEPTGDVTYLTLKAGDQLFEIKADREYRAALDKAEAVAFDLGRVYLFDADTGQRIR